MMNFEIDVEENLINNYSNLKHLIILVFITIRVLIVFVVKVPFVIVERSLLSLIVLVVAVILE